MIKAGSVSERRSVGTILFIVTVACFIWFAERIVEGVEYPFRREGAETPANLVRAVGFLMLLIPPFGWVLEWRFR